MSEESAIKQVLVDVVAPHLHPVNQLMRTLQQLNREDMMLTEWEEELSSSLYDDGDEIQQYWIVHNERLNALMIECGCKFVQFEELLIWCNPSSERFGLLAMHKLGQLLLDGVYDRHFIRRIMPSGKTDIQHYLGDDA